MIFVFSAKVSSDLREDKYTKKSFFMVGALTP